MHSVSYANLGFLRGNGFVQISMIGSGGRHYAKLTLRRRQTEVPDETMAYGGSIADLSLDV